MAGKQFLMRPAVVVAATLLLVGGVAGQQGAPASGEWRRNYADGGNTRYSPLDQINAANVKNLKVAWTWKGDNFGSGVEIKNENTPLMIDGVLYFTAGDRRAVVAADPGTGHWFTKIDDHIVYLMVRIDPDKVTPLKDEAASRVWLQTPHATSN